MYQRLSVSLLLFAALAVADSVSGAGEQSFEGKWNIDKASSTGSVPVPEGLRQTIKKHGDKLTVESVFKEPSNAIVPLLYLGIMTTTLNMNLDGSETVNQIGPYMQTSKTTIEGNKMSTEWVAKHTSGEVVNGHWVRTISDDGKHMTLEIQESSTQGQQGTATLQFTKK